MRTPGKVRQDGDVDEMQPGRIILLNGTSSSRKTTVANQLLLLLDPPHFHLAVDVINAMRAKQKTLDLTSTELATALRQTRAGFHRAVAGMAAAGNNVVMDHLLSEPWRLQDCLEVLAPFDVTFVGVRCSPEELTRREMQRGDRQVGTAAAQYSDVYAHADYDIEVDTEAFSPAECAQQIQDALTRASTVKAFDRLRRRCRSNRNTRTIGIRGPIESPTHSSAARCVVGTGYRSHSCDRRQLVAGRRALVAHVEIVASNR